MKNFKFILTLLVVLPLLLACNSTKKESGDIESVEIAKDSPLVLKTNKELEDEKKEKKILDKLGINTTSDGKIVIEPKKTKEFLDALSGILKRETTKLKEKNSGLTSEDLGVKADKDKIIIDTQKTKSFLEKFSKDLEDMATDIEKSVDGL